jgi:hypothetical protein
VASDAAPCPVCRTWLYDAILCDACRSRLRSDLAGIVDEYAMLGATGPVRDDRVGELPETYHREAMRGMVGPSDPVAADLPTAPVPAPTGCIFMSTGLMSMMTRSGAAAAYVAGVVAPRLARRSRRGRAAARRYRHGDDAVAGPADRLSQHAPPGRRRLRRRAPGPAAHPARREPRRRPARLDVHRVLPGRRHRRAVRAAAVRQTVVRGDRLPMRGRAEARPVGDIGRTAEPGW